LTTTALLLTIVRSKRVHKLDHSMSKWIVPLISIKKLTIPAMHPGCLRLNSHERSNYMFLLIFHCLQDTKTRISEKIWRSCRRSMGSQDNVSQWLPDTMEKFCLVWSKLYDNFHCFIPQVQEIIDRSTVGIIWFLGKARVAKIFSLL
jgi:hypothetical protein